MSFFVWCEIVCIGCASAIAGSHTTGNIPRREMKKEALASGWVFDESGDARCPRCAAGVPGPDRPSMTNV